MIVNKAVDNTTEAYNMFFMVFKGILGLTDKEIELMNTAIELGGIIGSDDKKYLEDKLNLKPSNQAKYINSLVEKRLLEKADDGIYVNFNIVPIIKDDTISVTFKFVIKQKPEDNG